MKHIVKSIIMLLALLVVSCNEGIDPITAVDAGVDETAPQVTISAPVAGSVIQVPAETTDVPISFQVTDDIEVGSISVQMNGSTIATYNGGFVDYRRVLVNNLVFEGLVDGEHELTVTATDLDGKSTSATVNFSKEPPYLPKYEGEILYMPFNGDWIDLISFQTPTVVGDPSFASEEESLNGSGAYAGAEGAYLTLPTDGLTNPEFSAIFWVKINAIPDRAGILTMSPPMTDGTTNDRNKGFAFFRENAGGEQRFKLTAGYGEGAEWFDGGEMADVDPSTGEWVNLAFTISGSEAVVYINGQVVSQNAFPGIDWTDCNVLSIMSGAPNFTEWNHLSDQSLMDELRIFNRAITQEEIQTIMADDSGEFVSSYPPTFDGEFFYMPFDGDYMEMFRETEATEVGNPGFAGESVEGTDAYAGAVDSYLTFPTQGLTSDNFSATMWYKMNVTENNAGILITGPEDTENAGYPEVQNLRTSGFRFFRENVGGMQRFKLNVGDGTADAWVDGGENADVDPLVATDWIHLAITISGSNAVVYIDGEPVGQNTISGIDWSDCDFFSIGSGAPTFTEWGHLSDESQIDELRFYNKSLTQEEVQEVMNN
ncbi:LamG domain-containing protein [Muricauda sp. HICW]|uniref:LamG domain-containing protein n=1 Tax=Flagellimonas chongwuensis TaxID=2697365 RepID=A0A850NMX1_9FLAO|nr:LamG-like jellyroll fold domain-containing protein [Allomuricauda chongwuensis]NVN18677.1 LamG domain-containing protein [Allomuricauda chongwuensis]